MCSTPRLTVAPAIFLEHPDCRRRMSISRPPSWRLAVGQTTSLLAAVVFECVSGFAYLHGPVGRSATAPWLAG